MDVCVFQSMVSHKIQHFVLGSYGSSAKVGDPVHYEELITFTTLSGPGGQVCGVATSTEVVH